MRARARSKNFFFCILTPLVKKWSIRTYDWLVAYAGIVGNQVNTESARHARLQNEHVGVASFDLMLSQPGLHLHATVLPFAFAPAHRIKRVQRRVLSTALRNERRRTCSLPFVCISP